MRRALAVLALVLAAWFGAMPIAAQTPPDLAVRIGGEGARDMVDLPGAPGGSAWLAPPALPPDYVTTRRGPLVIAYPRAMAAMVGPTLARAERDALAVGGQFGLDRETIPDLAVRLVPDPAAMRRLAPAAAPPPAYAVGVAYPAVRLALVSASAPRTWEASDMPRVLRHELSHLLLAEATGHAPVPRWLAEGIAVEQAGEHSFERFEQLAVASFTGGILPLRRLDTGFAEGPGDVNVAYAQSTDFVEYLLRTDGAPRFAVLLAHLRAGAALPDAVRETYDTSLDHIEEEWRHDLQSRFALAPLWAGTGVAWVLGAALLVVAMVRRRRRSRATLARWAVEERARRAREGGRAVTLTVVTPGLGRATSRSYRAGAEVEDDLPKIALDGEHHTLH